MHAAEDVLLARSFDLESLELSGAPVPVVTGVQRAVRSELDSASDLRWRQTTGFASYGFSDTGTLVDVEEEEVPEKSSPGARRPERRSGTTQCPARSLREPAPLAG